MYAPYKNTNYLQISKIETFVIIALNSGTLGYISRMKVSLKTAHTHFFIRCKFLEKNLYIFKSILLLCLHLDFNVFSFVIQICGRQNTIEKLCLLCILNLNYFNKIYLNWLAHLFQNKSLFQLFC